MLIRPQGNSMRQQLSKIISGRATGLFLALNAGAFAGGAITALGATALSATTGLTLPSALRNQASGPAGALGGSLGAYITYRGQRKKIEEAKRQLEQARVYLNQTTGAAAQPQILIRPASRPVADALLSRVPVSIQGPDNTLIQIKPTLNLSLCYDPITSTVIVPIVQTSHGANRLPDLAFERQTIQNPMATKLAQAQASLADARAQLRATTRWI
jgi:hypothetical protein